MEAMTPTFKKHGLTQEAVQDIINEYAPHVQKMVEGQQQQAIDSFKKMSEEWKTETIDTLGADHKKELAFAAKAVDKFGSDELRALMDDTLVGNNVHMAKFLISVGKAIADDAFPDSGRTGVSRDTDAGRADIMFPTSAKNG